MAKTISHCQGKGSLTHNKRTFSAANVDVSRTKDNVTFVDQPIDQAYNEIFGAAVERYNAKQKRADRRISTSYFEHAFNRKTPPPYVVTSADKRKSFYEDVVQIGTMDDTGVGSPDGQIAAECLTEYVKGFTARNPNFHVFFSALHLDERTPHLHIDYIPVGHYKQGVDTQNGLAQALKEMGYGTGKDAINRWRLAERAVLEQICKEHGIEISAPEKSRGSLTVEAYKEYAQVKAHSDELKKEVERLDERAEYAGKLLNHRENLRTQVENLVDDLDEQYQSKSAAVEQLDAKLSEKNTALKETTAVLVEKRVLLEASAKKVAQIKSIDNIETGKTVFGGKVTVSRDDYDKLADLAKKQIAAESKENSLQSRIMVLETENQNLNAEKEQLTKQNAELQNENGKLQSVYGQIAISKMRSERDNLQRKLDKVMEFIKNLGLAEKLQAFLNPKARGKHR